MTMARQHFEAMAVRHQRRAAAAHLLASTYAATEELAIHWQRIAFMEANRARSYLSILLRD